MTQEEKAKRYDESYKVAESIHRLSSDPAEIKRMEEIFPELKESEDELTWLKRFIQEEINYLSIFMRDSEDCVKLKNLQRSISWLEKHGEQNPAWSEEDERHLNSIIKRTIAYGDSSIHGLIKDDIDWIKGIKDRVQPQPKPKWKPSDEQMEALKQLSILICQEMTKDIQY